MEAIIEAIITTGGLEKAGIAILAILSIYVLFKVFQIVIKQWENSTDAVNKNTTAFQELTQVFKRANEREIEWQEKAMEIMKDTHKKVNKIHDKVV